MSVPHPPSSLRPRLQAALALVAFAAGLATALGRGDALASGAGVSIEVSDGTGAPLADAVVWLEPLDARSLPAPARSATIEQAARRFAPRTSIVQTGTSIAFPNLDTVRHHVYSFSPAKPFELKLYAGVPAAPVLFDKPGNVVIGCNIHDRMIAWVQVVDTPWFGKSDAAGRVQVGPMPAGEYRLRSFHPDQREPSAERRLRLVGSTESAPLVIELKPGAARP